jgi:hypothetical protein
VLVVEMVLDHPVTSLGRCSPVSTCSYDPAGGRAEDEYGSLLEHAGLLRTRVLRHRYAGHADGG